MSKYIMRLDDAAIKMDIEKWTRIEILLDKYNIKPLVGVIPDCKDPMMDIYDEECAIWCKVDEWIGKGWTIALHGYQHIYCTNDGGINPVNVRSEFAGLALEEQKRKIREGVRIFRKHGIDPQVFFAPSHTFDKNTIEALKEESNIKIISDTVANKPYCQYGMLFVPQQSGRVRRLPFKIVTFCYHPNNMDNIQFDILERFLMKYKDKFINFEDALQTKKLSSVDKILKWLYFLRRYNG